MSDTTAERYFPASSAECPTYVDDSEWHPLLDGQAYLTELAGVLRAAGKGDTVSVAGLELDPSIDLDGRPQGDPEHEPLGTILARSAVRGADVRVLLASRVLASSLPGSVVGGFRVTALNAETLRMLRPPGSDPSAPPPLTGRVMLDHSGPLLGSNHQKFVVAHVGGLLTAFVGGIDLVDDRFDAAPHARLRLEGRRWGWHDAAVRLRGPAAARVWDVFAVRWREASSLPQKHFLRRPFALRPLNPQRPVAPPGPAPEAPPRPNPGTAVRVLRSTSGTALYSVLPARRVVRTRAPQGVHEIHETLVTALSAARRYIYLEDQYLGEAIGGDASLELYPQLRAAARRGVKVVLVGSGVRDPQDTGIHPMPINRFLNRDLRRKLVAPLDPAHRGDVGVFRIEHVTVHAKLVLVDDAFACIGSANMFSRSMAGTDSELSAAVATTGPLVRDVRVTVWADHLRVAATDEVRSSLEDLDVALGMWRADWSTRRRPAAFDAPGSVIRLVGP